MESWKAAHFYLQFILCGILYILTEYNPTKKTVRFAIQFFCIVLYFLQYTVIMSL